MINRQLRRFLIYLRLIKLINSDKNWLLSLTNIPTRNKDGQNVSMDDKLVRKIRWKIFHFNLDTQETVQNEYGKIFRTSKNPKEDKNLERFENDLYN